MAKLFFFFKDGNKEGSYASSYYALVILSIQL